MSKALDKARRLLADHYGSAMRQATDDEVAEMVELRKVLARGDAQLDALEERARAIKRRQTERLDRLLGIVADLRRRG